MMEFTESKDICISKLTTTKGHDLEIMSNIQHSSQMSSVIEGFISRQLNEPFGTDQYQMLLRLSIGWKARGRDDLKDIGKSCGDSGGWGGSSIGTIDNSGFGESE